VCLAIGRSSSHFQSALSLSLLAVMCVCEEAKGGRIGVGMKVGHSRFCSVVRLYSRLTASLLNGGREAESERTYILVIIKVPYVKGSVYSIQGDMLAY